VPGDAALRGDATLSGEAALTVVREAVGIVCEVDPGTLSPDTTFDSLAADSLARVSIADVVEASVRAATNRDLRIDDATLGRMVALGELADYLVASS
jgi:acyl carrier protein